MSTRSSLRSCALALAIAGAGCSDAPVSAPWSPDADAEGHSAPTAATVAANAALAATLPLDDTQDFEDARRGYVGGGGPVVIRAADGRTIWDTTAYAFVEGDAPDSVNPSLWRQAKLNGIHGLFEVAPGIHQVRGYDLSNLTLIEGETGFIIVDPLTTAETAAAAMALAREHLGDRPVSAVILTHSHIDHFGGIDGALPAGAREDVPIVAPAGFLHEATSENIMAGPAMIRRASYMYGMPLARTPRGHVDTGLGKEPARGSVGLIQPTLIVDRTPQEVVLDGVRFVFMYAPESEAPAELMFHLPDKKAFCGAEVVSHNMHNVYTLRGAKVRDALRWSDYIQEVLDRFGDAEILFASHHWPTWGRDRVSAFLARQRDTYKYIHDQTLRMAGGGLTPREIAERIDLPESLAPHFGNRGYYGTARHNAKAVYQWYFGWYDANPAHLDPLPPAEAGARYVEFMGGATEVKRKAREAFERGEYRWVATVLDHLVFAEPDDAEARELLARSYDQLAYVAESGPWRDVYLTGARELRHGPQPSAVTVAASLGVLERVPPARFFDSMATRIHGERAAQSDARINFVFSDLGESHVLWIENGVLHHAQRDPDPAADATVQLTHRFFLNLVIGQLGLREALFSDELDIDGSRTALLGFFRLLEAPNEDFPIVTP